MYIYIVFFLLADLHHKPTHHSLTAATGTTRPRDTLSRVQLLCWTRDRVRLYICGVRQAYGDVRFSGLRPRNQIKASQSLKA